MAHRYQPAPVGSLARVRVWSNSGGTTPAVLTTLSGQPLRSNDPHTAQPVDGLLIADDHGVLPEFLSASNPVYVGATGSAVRLDPVGESDGSEVSALQVYGTPGDGKVPAWNVTTKRLEWGTPSAASGTSWVDLGLIDLVAATMDGPVTLYDIPDGSFLASIRFTDDPETVQMDTGPEWPMSGVGTTAWVAIGTVKSFGWHGFAGLGGTSGDSIALTYDTLALAAAGNGYGPLATLDTEIDDSHSVVLSAAAVGPIQAGLLISSGLGTGMRQAPIGAYATDTFYGGVLMNPAFEPGGQPGSEVKAFILAEGTLWYWTGGYTGSTVPDFSGDPGSVVDTAQTSTGRVSLPLTIVAGVNDQFTYTPTGGVAETFTFAAGVYTTLVEVATAMNAATGTSADTFSDYATVRGDTPVIATLNGALWIVANDDIAGSPAFGAGAHDVLADLSITAGQFFGVSWYDTGLVPPTIGKVHAFAEIITPIPA